MTPSFWQGKKVLVTGHTGFKGSWLCYLLKMWGAEVSGLALAPEKNGFYLKMNLDEKVRSTIGDIRDLNLVKKTFEQTKPEIVFHLAAQALVRPSYVDPIGTYMTNVMGTAHILEALRDCSTVKSCVVVSSDKCYENKEWDRGYSEEDAMGGWDPYSSSKGCTELVTSSWVRSFFQDKEIGIASGRAGNVIGGGDVCVDRLVPDCIRAFGKNEKVILRRPESTRPWQHVLEPVSGYVTLAEANYKDSKKFRGGWNFGPQKDQDVTVKEVVETVVKKWGEGARFEVQSDGQMHEAHYLRLNCNKAAEKLNWKAAFNLEQAIEATVTWYKTAMHKPSDLESLTRSQIELYCQLAKRAH